MELSDCGPSHRERVEACQDKVDLKHTVGAISTLAQSTTGAMESHSFLARKILLNASAVPQL